MANLLKQLLVFFALLKSFSVITEFFTFCLRFNNVYIWRRIVGKMWCILEYVKLRETVCIVYNIKCTVQWRILRLANITHAGTFVQESRVLFILNTKQTTRPTKRNGKVYCKNTHVLYIGSVMHTCALYSVQYVLLLYTLWVD